MTDTAADNAYIDYDEIVNPAFSPYNFANGLVISTNDPSDTPLDLNTPLSRVLFDLQEVDTHIDTLTTSHALPLLALTKDSVAASGRILDELEEHITTLANGYERLEREIAERYDRAEETRRIADRLWQTVKLGRNLSRCLTLGRQLEAQMKELRQDESAKVENHRVMIRAAQTIIVFGQICRNADKQSGFDRVNLIKNLQADLFRPAEKTVISTAEHIINSFSISSLVSASSENNSSYSQSRQVNSAMGVSQSDDTRSRLVSALFALYLLSPVSPLSSSYDLYTPSLLITTLEAYLQRSITASLAALTRSLGTLPTLDETLRLISGRCQNIVALETLLSSIRRPTHPLLAISSTQNSADSLPQTLLPPLLSALDTPSLPTYFWRTLASRLPTRLTELLKRGGAPARTLRTNREAVKDSIRECVNKGCMLPASEISRGREVVVGGWEREAAVMVGAVGSVLGR